MATIRHEISIDVHPKHVWAALRDIGAVHERLLPEYVVDTRIDGDVRFLTMPGGNVIRELIVTIDDEARRLAYSAVEGFQLPLTHHHASFQVLDADNGRSTLVWVTDVLPHDAADQVRPRVERGAQVIKTTIEQHHPA
ncbi:SRPBCC family protein [Nocardia sp. NPDC004604]|uniref:SRPBCC family protein n=1 Tax=Nocardia sp. NPDC004604 TaxID=3157013 RepID=UPI0033AF0BC0